MYLLATCLHLHELKQFVQVAREQTQLDHLRTERLHGTETRSHHTVSGGQGRQVEPFTRQDQGILTQAIAVKRLLQFPVSYEGFVYLCLGLEHRGPVREFLTLRIERPPGLRGAAAAPAAPAADAAAAAAWFCQAAPPAAAAAAADAWFRQAAPLSAFWGPRSGPALLGAFWGPRSGPAVLGAFWGPRTGAVGSQERERIVIIIVVVTREAAITDGAIIAVLVHHSTSPLGVLYVNVAVRAEVLATILTQAIKRLLQFLVLLVSYEGFVDVVVIVVVVVIVRGGTPAPALTFTRPAAITDGAIIAVLVHHSTSPLGVLHVNGAVRAEVLATVGRAVVRIFVGTVLPAGHTVLHPPKWDRAAHRTERTTTVCHTRTSTSTM
jgi:hypothetical protein